MFGGLIKFRFGKKGERLSEEVTGKLDHLWGLYSKACDKVDLGVNACSEGMDHLILTKSVMNDCFVLAVDNLTESQQAEYWEHLLTEVN